MKRLLGFSAVVCALSGTAFAGPDWVEIGDAGNNLSTAQRITGIGTPVTIEGSLSNSWVAEADLEDMYLLRIETPSSFRFDLSLSSFDSMLYLFNVTQAQEALGLLANNDAGPSTIGSLIN